MRTPERDELVAARGAVQVHLLAGAQGVDEAVTLLDEAESRVEAPLVDEAERKRLHALAVGGHEPGSHWYPLLARHDKATVGYAGVVLASSRGGTVNADLAVDRAHEGWGDAVAALFDAIRELAERHAAGSLVVWIRDATEEDVGWARAGGFGLQRRLLVLGRDVDRPPPEPVLPTGLRVRPYREDVDDDAVVDVLSAAFQGGADADWDHARLVQRRSFRWFDAADLLLAEDAEGNIPALHWTKRRGGGVGEVYVLAVTPAAQGKGLGRGLLRAGLHHLRDRGCHEVLLWVDEDNLTAIHLYRSEGFSSRWVDVAFDAKL